MQNENPNSNREKCETVVESLYKEFSLRHKKELEKQKASISESYNAKNSYYSGAHIMAIVKAEIDYNILDRLCTGKASKLIDVINGIDVEYFQIEPYTAGQVSTVKSSSATATFSKAVQ